MNHSTSATLRLPVSRHLQDFNGYCGPACALMVVEFTGSAKSPPVFAQNEFFKEVRSHAKANKDRRPVKSPAESLLNMLNDHTAGDMEWVKTFNSETTPVAQEIIRALDQKQQPCLMLVSKGMHWVVAFGLQRKDDGTPAGLLMRDPAWAGMPKFYGLSIFPDEPAIKHSQSPCPCLDHTDNPPGAVHERYITMHELISGRGLQGSPDWEGDGAIALVPNGVATAAILPGNVAAAGFGAAPFLPAANPLENAGQTALDAVRENGLYGRPDSPADWNAALKGATAGEPILVKDPDDSDDDFYLVPLIPSDPDAKHGAWAMLDTETLALREVSLLENWQTPVFPSEDSDDAEKASKQNHILPDGSSVRFKRSELRPNTNNLVWAPSPASALPYWPVKELIATNPVTGEPVSIYVNQEGDVFNHLLPDHLEPTLPSPTPRSSEPSPNKAPSPSSSLAPSPSNFARNLAIGLGATTAALLGVTGYLVSDRNPDGDDSLKKEISSLREEVRDKEEERKAEEDKADKLQDELDDSEKSDSAQILVLKKNVADLTNDFNKANDTIGRRNITIKQLQDSIRQKDITINRLQDSNRNKDITIGKTQDTIDRHQANYNKLKDRYDKNLIDLTHTKKQLDQSKKTVTELNRRLTVLTTELNRVKREYAKLQADIKDVQNLRKQIAELIIQRNKEMENNRIWAKRFRDLFNENEKGKLLIKTKETQIAELAKRLNDLLKRNRRKDP